jgi:hypothetical protein
MDTAAAVMSANNDVLHLEHIDRKLHHGKGVEVRMHDHIGHVTMNKNLAWSQTDKFLRRHPAVGTPYPEVLGSLLDSELLKELWIPCPEILCPSLIIGKEFGER